MGGRSSREASPRSSFRSAGSFQERSHSQDQYWSQRYPYETPGYQNYPPPSHSYGEPVQAYHPPPPPPPQTQRAGGSRPRLDRRYSKITDDYSSVEQGCTEYCWIIDDFFRQCQIYVTKQQDEEAARVTEALAQAGLESSNLIVGIDFTKSNEWTGKLSFHGRSLHHIGDIPNPYEQAISIIGKTLSAFDEDNLIPCFGFGDASTHDQDIFSFYPDERSCDGFTEALARYRELVPRLRLAGPTSFAPIIEMAMTIVEQNGGQYHVLLIIADGQVTRSVDTEFGQLSSQEQMTVDAIVKASEFPLSIVLVGVGDGPWDMMKEFDDNIPARSFDNFQFVNFTEIMSKNMPQTRKEAAFSLAALMEIPSQYKATLELGILGRRSSKSPERVPLPPPIGGYGTSSSGSKTFQKPSFQKNAPPYSGYDTTPSRAPTAPSASLDNQLCPICFTNPKDMAFGCGHQTCCDCGEGLELCPICRSQIQTRIKLY